MGTSIQYTKVGHRRAHFREACADSVPHVMFRGVVGVRVHIQNNRTDVEQGCRPRRTPRSSARDKNLGFSRAFHIPKTPKNGVRAYEQREATVPRASTLAVGASCPNRDYLDRGYVDSAAARHVGLKTQRIFRRLMCAVARAKYRGMFVLNFVW
ncbi:hypothetical protein MRX96_039068 [Rhipicephalus microplus]